MTKKRVSKKIQTSTLRTMPMTPPKEGGRMVPREFIPYDGTKEEEIEALKAGSQWFYVRISYHVTGSDRRSVLGRTVFPLTRPYNKRYAVKYHVFALILALCRARIITNPTMHTSSA
jgi:hypothetical protein